MDVAHVISSPRVVRAVLTIALAGPLGLAPFEASSRETSAPVSATARPVEGPLLILVSLSKQRLKLYDRGGEVTSTRISSGRRGFDTPTGVFTILQKRIDHVSNIYDASMPFMQRLTWSGIALHAGQVPGYPASHGCVRLPYQFARSFFGQTELSTRVIIARDDVHPVDFAESRLFRPLPPGPINVVNATTALNTIPPSPVNDAGTLIGVTPAEAAPSAGKPRSRAEVSERTEKRRSELEGALANAKGIKDQATKKAKSTLVGYNAAKDALDAALERSADARKAADAASRRLSMAEEQFASLTRSIKPGLFGGSLEKVSDAELDSEDAVLDAAIQMQRAEADLSPFAASTQALQSTFDTAQAVKAAAVDEVKDANIALRKSQTELVAFRREQQELDKPVSILVSLKAQKLTIRRGMVELAEAPITINGAPQPIGTHVLTAMGYSPDGRDLVWRLVTAALPRQPQQDDAAKDRRSRQRISLNMPRGDQTEIGVEKLRAGLARIEIPSETTGMIAELIKPGSSVMISDLDQSHETGEGTDFILLTR